MNIVEEYNCYRYNEEWYLIEMVLNIKPSNILFDEFVVPEKGVQPNNWQTAFLEQYLNESGTERICDLYDVPKDELPYSRISLGIFTSIGIPSCSDKQKTRRFSATRLMDIHSQIFCVVL